MKKFLLAICVIVVIIALSVSFLACDTTKNSLQSHISEYNPWSEKVLPEIFEYEMKKIGEDTVIGSLITEVKPMAKGQPFYAYEDGVTTTKNKEATLLYTFTADKNSSYIISNKLTLNDGSYSQTTYTCVYNNLQFFGSYTKIVENGKTTVEVKQNTDDKKCYFKRVVDGVISEDKMNGDMYVVNAYYDNSMLYTALRIIPVSFSGYGFELFDTNTKKKTKVSTTTEAVETKYLYNGVEYEYRKTSAYISNDLTGKDAAVSCYVVNSNQRINGFDNVVLAIFEGDYSYTLK